MMRLSPTLSDSWSMHKRMILLLALRQSKLKWCRFLAPPKVTMKSSIEHVNITNIAGYQVSCIPHGQCECWYSCSNISRISTRLTSSVNGPCMQSCQASQVEYIFSKHMSHWLTLSYSSSRNWLIYVTNTSWYWPVQPWYHQSKQSNNLWLPLVITRWPPIFSF